jgi:hypothetical protein
MNSKQGSSPLRNSLGLLVLLAVAACGGGGSSGGGTPSPSTISGSISGLVGKVVLQNNGTDTLTLTSNGSFAFATPVPAGQAYSVTILTQPTGPDCTVAQGAGTATGSLVSVSVTCEASATTFYLPLTASPPLDTSTGTTGLFVISSKVPGTAPISIMSGRTNPIGYTFNSQGQPTTLAFSSWGAAAGDHIFTLDLTGNSSLVPVQISSLMFANNGSVQNCGVTDAYGNLTDPNSAFFIIGVPTDPVNLCGGGSFGIKRYLVHATDDPNTSPVELPALGPLVVLYHANGVLSGFVTANQSNQLVFYPGVTFTNPVILLSGVNGYGTLQSSLSQLSQIPADPTYALLAIQSMSGAFSVYRVDDSGQVSADLYDFQGSYDNGVITDTSNLYFTDSYGSNVALIERIVQVPLNGSAPATVLFQDQPANNQPYYLVGTTPKSVVLETFVSNPPNGAISYVLATLPIGIPATPTAIASYPTLVNVIAHSSDIFVTQSTEGGLPSSSIFSYSTEILGPDGTVIQPLQSNSSFLLFDLNPLLEVTGVTDPGGYGGGTISALNLTQPLSPTPAPLKSVTGNTFAFPTGSEFVSNIPVTSTLGWINDSGVSTDSQYVYDLATNTISSVSIPNATLSIVGAPM